MAAPGPSRADRLGVLSRTIAGVFGSYALATIASLTIALAMPGNERDAVQLSAMVGFLLYGAGVVWAFSTETAWRAWAGIGGATLAFILLLLIVKEPLL